MNPDIWGPHYWFFLHTIALHYPLFPNAVTKKKYYDFFQNFPLFIPSTEMGNQFSELLDKYPVSPYLDGRESLIIWVHHMHNIINKQLNKPILSYKDAMAKSEPTHVFKDVKLKKYIKYMSIIVVLVMITYYLY